MEQAKQCPKGHTIPSPDSIRRAFSLDEASVVCMYVVGSHLWGTCRQHSDWDLVVIVNPGLSRKPVVTPKNAHKGLLDLWLLSVDDYCSLLKEHSLQAIVTVWVPECLKIQQDTDPKCLFRYSRMDLFASANKMYERDVRVAKKHFSKGANSAGKKTLTHCLRHLQFAAQIQEHCSIVDYLAPLGDDIHETGDEGDTESQWMFVWSIFQPLLDQLLMKIRT